MLCNFRVWEKLFQKTSEDVLVAGPPCQPYSILNANRFKPGYTPWSTENARPFLEIARHVRKRRPRSVVLEEVCCLKRSRVLLSRLPLPQIAQVLGILSEGKRVDDHNPLQPEAGEAVGLELFSGEPSGFKGSGTEYSIT